MNKILPLLAFSILLLIPVGVQNTFAGGPGCVPPPPNMVSWWPGDGNTNDIVDSNPGIPQGITFPAGHVSQGFGVSGGTHVSIPDAPNLQPQQLSIDAWVFANNAGGINDAIGGVIVSKDINAGPVGIFPDVSYGLFGPGNTGAFTAIVDTTAGTRHLVQSPPVVSPFGQFHHVGMIWDGQQLVVFVDGLFTFDANVNPDMIAYDSSSVGIGAHTIYVPDRHFNGIIDEVEFFDRALSPNEMLTIFNAGIIGKCKFVNPPEPEPQIVTGKIIPIESTALLFAGLQTSAIWLAPVVISAVGLGIVLVKRKF